MAFLSEYGLFLAKAVTVLVCLLIPLLVVASSAGRRGQTGVEAPQFEVVKLNDQFEDHEQQLIEATLEGSQLKAHRKARRKEEKQRAKADKKNSKKAVRRTFVLDFDGDIKASAVESLRHEISALLTILKPEDEVVVRLESGGGMVHSYGLAASQLARLVAKQIPLTVCVDKVAASGGYMMAAVANKIVAAPFALIGSIGVVAQLPNFNRLLRDNKVDFELYTAGEYKRTVTMFGENNDSGRAKFQQELDDTHELFQSFVAKARPQLNVGAVATGEVWYGQQAQGLGLIDELATSDDYLLAAAAEGELYQVVTLHKRSWQEKLGFAAEGAVERVTTRWLGRAARRLPL
ncbi:MAG: protease SohB [Porticoccaceae bacterium]